MATSNFAQFGAIGSGNEGFPNPFIDVASLSMPDSWRNALYWAEYLFSIFGTYRTAMERVISYFLTDVEIGGEVSDDEKDKWEEFLGDTVDVFTVLQNLLRDRICYGNALASVIVPIKRFLQCPKTGDMYPLKEVYNDKKTFNFEFTRDMQWIATCPKTGYRGPWKVVDKTDDEEKKIRIKRWSPHEIEILHDPYTDEVSYLWRIPEDYKRLVREGNLFHLERVSLQVLNAIKHNQVFRFNPDVIFHMKEPTLAGIRNRGWGIPRVISNYRQIYYVQVLRRFNEAIALDYVMPLRLITPMPRPGGGGGQGGGMVSSDPMQFTFGADFRNQVKTMITSHRRDPATWQVLPYPVQYQLFGAEANSLAPRDLLDQGMETLLNDAGTPVELYKGTLQLQAAPVALRLFESTWHHLVHDANAFLQWLVRQISQVMSWEAVEAKLKRVTIADDLNKQMMAAQLMIGQQLSGRSGLAAIGYDWDTEQKRLAEEALKQQQLQARQQEEMDQAGFAQQIAKGQGGQTGGAPQQGGGQAQGGAQAQAGMPMGGQPVSDYLQAMGQGTPTTPQEMLAASEQMAIDLMGLPESQKNSELRKLKIANPAMHSMVRSKIDAIRQQARQRGGSAVLQQQFGVPH